MKAWLSSNDNVEDKPKPKTTNDPKKPAGMAQIPLKNIKD